MPLHRGKISTPPDIISIRPLTREDLALLEDKRPVGSDGRPINGAVARFKDPHHRVARLFASGLRMGEVVAQSGYSYNRVKQLADDPAFQNLVATYRRKVDEAFVENVDHFYEQATSNMRMAERMIAEQLEAAEENDIHIPIKTLETIASSRMDRFGYGKRETRLNVNLDFAAQLEGAIKRSGEAKIINGTSLVQRSTAPLVPTQGEEVAHAAPRSESPTLDRRVLRRA